MSKPTSSESPYIKSGLVPYSPLWGGLRKYQSFGSQTVRCRLVTDLLNSLASCREEHRQCYAYGQSSLLGSDSQSLCLKTEGDSVWALSTDRNSAEKIRQATYPKPVLRDQSKFWPLSRVDTLEFSTVISTLRFISSRLGDWVYTGRLE